jgi:hypothetical protein
MGDNHNSNLKEVCENSRLIGIRRCKMAAADVVRSSQGRRGATSLPALAGPQPIPTAQSARISGIAA